MNKINVGVIGLGVGKYHAVNFLNHPNCNLKVICDLKPKKNLNLPSSLKKIYFTQNDKEVLLNKNLDLVCIASKDDDHFRQIKLALNNNKHIFVEKPICVNEKEFKIIIKLLKKKPNLNFSTNLVLRNHPYIKRIEKLIKKRELGKIYFVEAEYNYGRIEKILKGWRGQINNYSIIYGGGIHIIDIITKLFGSSFEIKQVIGNKIVSKNSKFKNNDFITSNIKFKNGMIGKLNFNFGCALPHSHVFRIYGTKGTYILNSFEEQLIKKNKKKMRISRKKIVVNHNYKKKILNSFVEFLCNNKKPIVSKKEALNSMSLAIKFNKLIK